MTDEELGRAWCEAAGHSPLVDTKDGWRTWSPVVGLPDAPHRLPPPLHAVCGAYPSDTLAYAAVGAALRRVWAFAAESRRQCEPVPAVPFPDEGE